jgi:hypothetical protein
MFTVYEYATHPRGTSHLVTSSRTDRTLCGQFVGAAWEQGDESMSGIAATCARCKAIANRAVRNT